MDAVKAHAVAPHMAAYGGNTGDFIASRVVDMLSPAQLDQGLKPFPGGLHGSRVYEGIGMRSSRPVRQQRRGAGLRAHRLSSASSSARTRGELHPGRERAQPPTPRRAAGRAIRWRWRVAWRAFVLAPSVAAFAAKFSGLVHAC